MKSIKELELLVNFAKSLGQTPDPKAVEQIREHYEFQKKIIESVKANSSNDLSEAFGRKIEKESKNELVQTQTIEEDLTEETLPDTASTEQSLAERAAQLITEAPKKDSYQQPSIPLVDNSMKAVQDKLKFLEQWLGKVSLAGPGGGAVNLKDLDDVSKYSITNATERQSLTYNAQSKLWIASNQDRFQDRLINGNAVVLLDSAGETTHPGNIIPLLTNVYTLGSPNLKWKEIFVGPGSVYIEDVATHINAALTVENGILRIDGANQLQVGQLKFIDNTIESLTGNIDIQIGLVESTANLVLNRNVVLASGKTLKFADNTEQTTAYIPMLYGQFWDTTTQSCAANTATAISYNSTDGHDGINLTNANTRVVLPKAGVYDVQFSAQLTNTANDPVPAFIWIRQNGADVPNSASVVNVPGVHSRGTGASVPAWNWFITTTTPNEYVELMWFSTDETRVKLRADAAANLIVGTSPPIPQIPSIILTVDQIR